MLAYAIKEVRIKRFPIITHYSIALTLPHKVMKLIKSRGKVAQACKVVCTFADHIGETKNIDGRQLCDLHRPDVVCMAIDILYR